MENSAKTLLTGNWIMALCGVFYLAWWIVAFRPPQPRSTPISRTLLTLAFLSGIAGFYLMGRTLDGRSPRRFRKSETASGDCESFCAARPPTPSCWRGAS